MGTIKRKLASVSKECVACGSCVKVCPKEAITIYKGLFAKVDSEKCIGCTRCQKTLVRLSLDSLRALSHFRFRQYPLCMAGAYLFCRPLAYCYHREK